MESTQAQRTRRSTFGAIFIFVLVLGETVTEQKVQIYNNVQHGMYSMQEISQKYMQKGYKSNENTSGNKNKRKIQNINENTRKNRYHSQPTRLKTISKVQMFSV